MRIKRENVIYENVTLNAVGNTVVGGHVIAQHGRLAAHPRCSRIDAEGKDITLYKTVTIDGIDEQVPDVQPVEDVKVEVIPEIEALDED